jgi:Fringe-like
MCFHGLSPGIVQPTLCFDHNGKTEMMEQNSHQVPEQDFRRDKTPSDNNNETVKSPILDILSTGSIRRLGLLEAQSTTFAHHPAVRMFRTTTEYNDTDAQCHETLTEEDVQAISTFCLAPYPKRTETAHLIRGKKFLPKDGPGWLCAQKRPIDGLEAIMKEYPTDDKLPDYLMLIDDDTYVNVPEMLRMLSTYHPPNAPDAVSGCRYISPIPLNFGFPIGGFGAILTRRTLQNMRKPINCQTSKPDKFTQFACWRLQVNDMLERRFFRNGMSVMELLFAYNKGMPFSGHKQWSNGQGFCLHSDLALAYFVNYYHVAVPDDVIKHRSISDAMRMKYLGFINFNNTKTLDQCAFDGHCQTDSKICHRVTPPEMRYLWDSMQPAEH